MKKRILIIVGMLLASSAIAAAVISSYGSITGFATVQQAVIIDILGTSGDNYTLSSVHQGETKYSPEIKLDNRADVSVNVSISLEILPGSAGDGNDVELGLVNEFQNESLPSTIVVPTTDLRFYVRHVIKVNANLGEYFFRINVTPS